MNRAMNRKSRLPAVLAELVDVAGPEAAWALIRVRGGTTVYLPREVGADHWLSQAVGVDAAAKICRHFSAGSSGMHLSLPTAGVRSPRQRLVQELRNGASAAQAALAAGMTERSAYRHRARLKDDDDDQGRLL